MIFFALFAPFAVQWFFLAAPFGFRQEIKTALREGGLFGLTQCVLRHRFVQIVIQSKAPGLLGEKSATDDGNAEEQIFGAYWALFYAGDQETSRGNRHR